MSFSKRSENAQVCYTKPLDSLKNWNDHFFWVDASILPLAIPWHRNKTLKKDPPPLPTGYNADVCDYLATNPAPFKKFSVPFLCFVGISWYYILDDGCYPTYWDDEDKGRIGEREVREGEVPLLELTRGRVIPLVGVNDQGGADALVADKPKKVRKRKTVDGASGSGLPPPPKRLREDHGTSGDASASTTGKSLVALQDLLDKSTLAAEIGVTAAAIVPFVTFFVTPMPEHKGGGHADSVSIANLRTNRPAERFLISSNTLHGSSANAADDEVSSVVRSIVPDPTVLTTAIATTVVAGTSVSFSRGGDEPARANSFYVSLDIDSETLHQTYVPKWDILNESALDESNLLTEFNVRATRQTCLGAEVRMRLEHVFRGKKRLEGKCGMQANLLKERDAEIVDLKARLSLRESKAAEAIRLRGQIANVEAAEASRAGELESLKKRNVALEGRITALESAAVAKDSEVAKLTLELSSLQLSCDDLSIKSSTLECEKDKLVDQEATCSGLRDEVAGYKLLKEHVEAVQDEQVIDSDLMDMALHMDEEFYPRYLTTIARRRWILGRGLKLAVIKCLQSPEYLSALGEALGRAIEKDGLAAGIDHGRAGKGLDDIAAYDPSAEANFDASMADIMDLLRLEGPAAKTPEASQLPPSPEQPMVPIHRLTGEASTFRFPATTTSLSTTFAQASTVPPAPFAEVPPSPKIVFEQEELDTTPEHASAL
ncbi:hypothetical protein Tco_0965584 [Tanacetum coccineum]